MPGYIPGEDVADTYEGRRWQIARAEGLLLESDALYLAIGAERLPLVSDSVDVVLTRNSLDHVASPVAVMDEVARVLRPGATLILSVDVDHPATETEPHTFTRDDVRALLGSLEPVSEQVRDEAHGGGGGRRVVVVARRPQP